MAIFLKDNLRCNKCGNETFLKNIIYVIDKETKKEIPYKEEIICYNCKEIKNIKTIK